MKPKSKWSVASEELRVAGELAGCQPAIQPTASRRYAVGVAGRDTSAPRCRRYAVFCGRLVAAGLLLFPLAVSPAPISPASPPSVLTEDVARFTQLLRSAVPARRVEGVQGLSQLKHWPSEGALLGLLEDSSPAVRREVILALCRLGTVTSVPRLISLLDDPSWELRQNAWLGLGRMTGESLPAEDQAQWREWWNADSLEEKAAGLLAIAEAPPAAGEEVPTQGQRVANVSPEEVASGRRRRSRGNLLKAPACPERREALRALRHLATKSLAAPLAEFLRKPHRPALDPAERAFVCEALERVGGVEAIPVLAEERSEAAAWALGGLGGREAEAALLQFPKTLAVLLALDRVGSTNGASFLPQLVDQMGLITFRGQPDDVMNEELQPVQRAAANLIRRSGQTPLLTELVLQELEETMLPPLSHGPRPVCPPEWVRMLQAMRSELKPGFVREDGVTTSQPIAAVCYATDDSGLGQRLLPLLRHPSVVARVYIALTLGRLGVTEAAAPLTAMIREGYGFSDAVALASGKHFEQSQSVRWRGFLCMALGRLGSDEARTILESLALDQASPRDIRYGSVVGLGFIASPHSLDTLREVAQKDVIWMVRDDARRVVEKIEELAGERSGGAGCQSAKELRVKSEE